MAQIDGTTTLEHSNFKMFLATVNTFRYSQGFYSRLARDIEEWSDEQRADAEEYFNSLPQRFNDTLDVVLFLEQ